jgi:hypothetical protein
VEAEARGRNVVVRTDGRAENETADADGVSAIDFAQSIACFARKNLLSCFRLGERQTIGRLRAVELRCQSMDRMELEVVADLYRSRARAVVVDWDAAWDGGTFA